MAKLPRYIKIEREQNSASILSYKLIIKRWGMPILIYKCLKESYELKWYQWLLYPYFCFKVMR